MSAKRYTAKPSDLIEVENGYLVLHSDYAALEARYVALREAVRWMLEYLDAWLMTRMGVSVYAEMETLECFNLARAAVDALVGEG